MRFAGPLFFATFVETTGSYAAGFYTLSAAVAALAVATMVVQVAAAISMPFVGREDARDWYLAWLAVTGLFGLCFLGVELYEFAHLIHEGATPQRAAARTSAVASPPATAT